MDPSTQTRIENLLKQNKVVLFMKGVRGAPRCGFSARATQYLDALLEDYLTVDVLSDEEIRQGIKAYGQFPTIPQLYIKGELIGGSDIIAEMYNKGELHEALELPAPERVVPSISISAEAAQAIKAGMEDDPDLKLHLSIDGRWQAQFQLAPLSGGEIRAQAAGIDIYLDLLSAKRADGMQIEWAESLQGAGLSVKLPKAPSSVRALSVEALKQRLDAGSIQVIDVRPEHDRARAPFVPAEAFDAASRARLESLPKQQPLAFLCHIGRSSMQVAEHFRQLGFSEVYNVEGGIEAWSTRIDASVPRY
jgi:monothiol glutaredoxin